MLPVTFLIHMITKALQSMYHYLTAWTSKYNKGTINANIVYLRRPL